MEKFHHFLYTSHLIPETDQQPLETILSKSLNQVTPRLQRILTRTFPYNFTVHYISGATNQLADCLSWLGDGKDTIKLSKLQVNWITQKLSARSDSLHQLSVHTSWWWTCSFETYHHARMAQFNQQVPPVLQPYWTFREELAVENGLILKGTRLLYQPSSRKLFWNWFTKDI